MTCQDAERLMQQKLDGFLEDSDAQALNSHLNECEHCRNLWEGMQAMQMELNQTSVSVPSSLHDSILNEIQKTPQSAKQLSFFRRNFSSIAACLLILLIVPAAVLFLNPDSSMSLLSAKGTVINEKSSDRAEQNASIVARDTYKNPTWDGTDIRSFFTVASFDPEAFPGVCQSGKCYFLSMDQYDAFLSYLNSHNISYEEKSIHPDGQSFCVTEN